jgi:hypothetical protein
MGFAPVIRPSHGLPSANVALRGIHPGSPPSPYRHAGTGMTLRAAHGARRNRIREGHSTSANRNGYAFEREREAIPATRPNSR